MIKHRRHGNHTAATDKARPPSRRRRRTPRRRGAPLSLVTRRIIALGLLLCAAAVAVHERRSTHAAAVAAAPTQSEGPTVTPLVLPIADAATVAVLHPGQQVDIYAAYGDQPPTLVAVALPLLDVLPPDGKPSAASTDGGHAHVVIGITENRRMLVEDLLTSDRIVATVTPVHPPEDQPIDSAKE